MRRLNGYQLCAFTAWLAIFSAIYALFVGVFCGLLLDSATERVVNLVCFHFLFAMLIWSVWAALSCPPALPPPRYHVDRRLLPPSRGDLRAWNEALARVVDERRLPLDGRPIQLVDVGVLRHFDYCDACACLKPPRCHHCSRCDSCQLLMDHHCPSLGNCVHRGNHKAFLLALGYGAVVCAFTLAVGLPHIVVWVLGFDELTAGRQILVAIAVIGAFYASTNVIMLPIFLCMQCRQIATGFTRLEQKFGLAGPDDATKDGAIHQVFGDDWRFWLLPTTTTTHLHL